MKTAHPETSLESAIQTLVGVQAVFFSLLIFFFGSTLLHALPKAWSAPVLSNDHERICTEMEVVEGRVIFEGDIELGTCRQDETGGWHFEPRGSFAQRATGILSSDPNKAAIVTPQYYWPGGEIPFWIHPVFTEADDLTVFGRIQAAVRHWNEMSTIRLIPRTDETDYLIFAPGQGCSAGVGYGGGLHYVRLAQTGACSYGTVVHEIGHSLGFWHEQSRQDRDSFINIFWERIQPGREGNFEQYTIGHDVNAYDYGSIMHYPATAFSIDQQPTIEALPEPYNAWAAIYGEIEIGQRLGLSVLDRLAADETYNVCWAGEPGAGWRANAWSRCVASCDSPGRSRRVFCHDESGACADASACDPASKPAESASCSGLLSCDFDTDSCGWDSADPEDDFDLRPATLGTPTDRTGPSFDHTGGGHYLFAEASPPRRPNDKAFLTSVPTNIVEGAELGFWYHYYGQDLGSLEVQVVPCGGEPITVWTLGPDPSLGKDLWQEERLILPAADQARIRFVFTRGEGPQGDIAIDDITFRSGALFADGFESGGSDRWSSTSP